VPSAQASSTRGSKASSVCEAQPNSSSSEPIAIQPVAMSSASARLSENERVRLPGKVIANTSTARTKQAPSKRAPNQAQAAASTATATSGSSMARSSAPGPGGVSAKRA
jgi:hypothetical protein